MSESHLNDRITPRLSTRVLEMYLWIFFAVCAAGKSVFQYYFTALPLSTIIQDSYSDLIAAVTLIVFPVIYMLIFGVFPFESFRINRAKQKSSPIKFEHLKPAPSVIEVRSTSTLEQHSESKHKNILFSYASDSRQIAKGIYGRAGVYLLVGVVVAFSGLVFFYSQTGAVYTTTDFNTVVIGMAPKFGMLFFIEFIAFFFLKQYRSAMDEFRYYDAVARTREEVSAIFTLTNDSDDHPLNPMDLIKQNAYFSKSAKLSAGETTEIIETRKMEKNEIELLEKIVESLGKTRK